MKYDILWADNIRDLVTLVNGAEERGWKPQGGVSSDRGRVYYQAVVTQDDDDANSDDT